MGRGVSYPRICVQCRYYPCSIGRRIGRRSRQCSKRHSRYKIDRISHSSRVLPLGGLQIAHAVILAAVLLGFGLTAAALVGPSVALSACLATALLSFYNAHLKRIPLVGNFAIGVAGGLPFLVGGLTVSWSQTFMLPGPLVPTSFAVLFQVVREIVKDVQDIEGDRSSGITTFPQMIGTRAAVTAALLLFLLLDILIVLPILSGWYNMLYAILAIGGVVLPVSALMLMAVLNQSHGRLQITTTGLKIGMAVGLLALVLGHYR